MLLSLNWIKKFINYEEQVSSKELGSLLSLRVAEVEGIKIVGEALEQVRTAKVEKTEPHPDADKLKLATINTGKELRTIVCGASNCRAGIIIPFADLGAKLTLSNKDGSTSTLVIKPTKIRGVESTGMLCSESELGLADESAGIMELVDVPLGVKLSELPQFSQDVHFEIDNKSLTHRPDLWGHYGFAREFQAMFQGTKLKPYSFQSDLKIGSSALKITNDTKQCRRYSGLEIKNIKVAPSPQWLSSRLTSLGINSINNIVDITNYILLELGQPMHSFDAKKLDDLNIKIRYAKNDEDFLSLDEHEYKLTDKDLVIDAGGKAIALAGIMGGLLSSIDETTTHVILESANFDSATIRRSSIRHNLRSDSSTRFEKSLDPAQTILAIRRAVDLILQVCPDAQVIGHIADEFTHPYPQLKISTSYDFICQRLGVSLKKEFIDKTLLALGFEFNGDLEITVPTWRSTKDISIPEDIVEEIGRIYGYDNIDAESLSFDVELPIINPQSIQQRLLKTSLTQGYGFSEVILYPWSGKKQLDFYDLSNSNLMTLKNPISEDACYMRAYSEPHFIDSIAENLKHFTDCKFFEIGRIYDTTQMDGELPVEKFQLTGAVIPKLESKSLQEDSFYEAKAIVIDLLRIVGINNYQIRSLDSNDSWVHPNISLGIYRGKQLLAQVYKLHPALAQKASIKHNVYLFSIYLDELKNVDRKFSYNIVSKYPTVPFDVTVVADKFEFVNNIMQVIRKSVKKNLINLEVFSIYEGDNLNKDKKAVSFRLKFGAQDHTLQPEEITHLQKEVMDKLIKAGYPIK